VAATKTVMICLLRGVNVGGHNMIKMDALRALCESLGHCDVQTYVQSGNVVFRTKERDITKVGKMVEDAIEKKHGFRPDVILRTTAEMREVIAKNPFAKRKGIEPGKLIVTLLADELGAETKKAVLALKPEPEEIRVRGRELYIYFPDGSGRSKLVPVLSKVMKNKGTGRNWTTVSTLLEMAEKLESRS
jgi:uncharacterized protein (DUF1697 family)